MFGQRAGATVFLPGDLDGDGVGDILLGLDGDDGPDGATPESGAALLVYGGDLPRHVDVAQVEASILQLEDVLAVHDLHVWTISSGRIALSGHVVAARESDRDKLLQSVSDSLHQNFQIEHSTIQIETEDFDEPGGVCFT